MSKSNNVRGRKAGFPTIKLIIVDFYGVMTLGSYKETCKWIAKKYHLAYPYVYKVVYHKYFNPAAVGKITERQSFEYAVQDLRLEENWRQLRKKHLAFQKLNRPVFNFFHNLQKTGITVVLLSKNTPPQFNYAMRKMKIRKYFRHIINTFDLGLPKASPKTIRLVLKKFRAKSTQTIMTDDQPFNLLEPAKLGVRTILYKNSKQLIKEVRESL